MVAGVAGDLAMIFGFVVGGHTIYRILRGKKSRNNDGGN